MTSKHNPPRFCQGGIAKRKKKMKKPVGKVVCCKPAPRKRSKDTVVTTKNKKADILKRIEALLGSGKSDTAAAESRGEVVTANNMSKSDVAVVIDGSNVVMKVGLDVLTAMLRVFTEPIVFFDANIDYCVAKRWPERLGEFKKLLDDNRGTIMKVAAHSRADGYILQMAEAWAEKYPFVKYDEQSGQKRIHGFRVVNVRGRRMLQIPDLGVYAEI